MSYDTILMDWAGTVTVSMGEAIGAAAVELGLSRDDLRAALGSLASYLDDPDSPFHQAERGEITDAEFAAELDRRAPGAGRLFSVEGPSFLNAPDRPAMVELMVELAEAGLFVVLATNNFAIAQEMLATRYLDTGLVGAIANSALLGCRKPDARYFETVLDSFDLEPSLALLVDDLQVNIDGVAAVGIDGVLVPADDAGVASAIDEIRRRCNL